MASFIFTDQQEFMLTLADLNVKELTAEQTGALEEIKGLLDEKDLKLSCKELQDGSLGGKFRLNDAFLLRFLFARNFDVAKSLSLLEQHFSWRNKLIPSSIRKEHLLPSLKDSGIYRMMGKTKEGYTIIQSQTKLFDPYAQELTDYLPYLVYILETSIRLHEEHTKNVWIFDLEGWTLTTHGTPHGNKYTKEMMTIAQNQYPERLHQALIINAPWLFSTAWKVISSWLDERTQTKVHFLDSPSDLQKFIHKSDLPKCYGGDRDDYPLHPE